MYKKKNRSKFWMMAVLLLIAFSCDEGVDTIIPDVPVNININTSRSPYLLLGDGNSMVLPVTYYQAGYAGILIYRASANTFFAYDRCCPYHVDERHQLEPDGALAYCPVDSSEFVLADGFGLPIKGPAEYSLKIYRTSTTSRSDGIWLHIFN